MGIVKEDRRDSSHLPDHRGEVWAEDGELQEKATT